MGGSERITYTESDAGVKSDNNEDMADSDANEEEVVVAHHKRRDHTPRVSPPEDDRNAFKVVQDFMLQKGLIANSMTESELLDFMEGGKPQSTEDMSVEDAEFESSDESPSPQKSKKVKSKKARDKGTVANKESIPSETTVYENTVMFKNDTTVSRFMNKNSSSSEELN